MALDAWRSLIGVGVKDERDGAECRGSAAATGVEGGGSGGGRTAGGS